MENEKKKEKEKRANEAKQAYEEWLTKKLTEEDEKPLNKSMSASMNSLPPFYPNSRTIPFGR